MKSLTHKTFQTFRTLLGSKFTAYLSHANTPSTTSKRPKRLLHVKLPCFVTVGQVVITDQREKILLLDYVNTVSDCRAFEAVEVNQTVSWIRPIQTVNAVSKMKETTGSLTLSPLHVTFDETESLNIEGKQVGQFQFMTGQEVMVGDLVDGKLISNIRKILGVKFVTAK